MNLSTSNSQQNECSESLIDLDSSFESMGLDHRITKAIKKMGFKNPTLVQSKSIPLSLQGKDILAKARTGSGKTAAYSIPIIQKILMAKEKSNVKGIKAIVLVPTRELCEQVKNHFNQMSSYCVHAISVIQLGSDKSIDEQKGLLRDIPDVVISTPTRLVQHLQSKTIQIANTLEMLVIDEADLVLSYGHQEEINVIKTYLPKVCQCFLMSATLTAQVEELKKLVLHTPAILKLEEDQVQQTNLSEYSIKCAEVDKFLLVFSLIRLKLMQGKILFFVNDTDHCYKLKLFLERFHIKSAVLNSELPINSRHDIILQFNKGLFDYLIATDESFVSDGISIKSEDKVKEELEDIEDNEDDEDDSDVSGEEFDIKEEKDSDDDEQEDEEDEEEEEKDSEDEVDVKDEPVSDEETSMINQDDDDDEIEIKSEDESEQEEEESNIKVKKEKGTNKKKNVDTEYGVARGIDFRNVDIVVNFDFPRTVKNYIHRIGRTARGDAKGIALSFVTQSNEDLLQKVHKKRTEEGYNLKPFEFKMTAIEGFRYRVEDVMRSIGGRAIKEARKNELKQEILNNEKLKSHFSENPQDLLALKHDTTLIKKKVSQHLKYIPEYLLPNHFKASANNKLEVIPSGKPKSTDDKLTRAEKRKAKKDILKSFNYKKNASLTPDQIQQERTKKLIRKYKITDDNLGSDGKYHSLKKQKTN